MTANSDSMRGAAAGPQRMARTSAAIDLICESVELECGAPEAEGRPPAPVRFRILAYSGSPMNLFGWRYPVVVDLAGLHIPSQSRPVRFAHDAMSGVGHTESIRIEGGKLVATAVISRHTPAAAEIVASARSGFPWQASIGAVVEEFEFIKENQVAVVNGQDHSGPVNVVRKATLGEISFVDLGADQLTSATLLAAARKESCSESGKDMQTENHAADENNVAGVQAEQRPAAPDDAHAEASRIEAIRRVCGERAELAARAIELGWTPRQAALELLRAERPRVQPSSESRHPPCAELEAAACLKYGIPERLVLAAYGEEVVDRASRLRSRGIQWFAQQIAARHGIELEASPGSAAWIRAAFSLSELSGLVGNVANKALAAQFEMAQATVPRIAAAVSHANFHQHTVYSLAVTGELQQVAPDGELKHLALGEESYTRQIETRGAILTITRQDLVNDDLGALTRAATALASKAIQAREKAMYKLINDTGLGASFFTAARGNYFSGATSALSADSLGTAVQKFRDQTDASGLPLLIEPRILLVPSSLEVAAKRLMSAQTFIATGVGSSRAIEGASNIWQGAFEVVVSPMLSSSALGGSTTAWYLLADPSAVPCFEVAYLNGNQSPVVEFFGLDQDANRLGVSYRVFWDFGTALAEYRAGVKSAGA